MQDPWPQTRAERTDYRETSRYDDVVAFLEALVARKAPLRLEWIGKSVQGRPIPLAICAQPMVSSLADARRKGKLVVYLQANIHAGEVEGKEAVLHLLRRIAQGEYKALLEKLVLVVTPIYNSDGNEKLGDNRRNRGSQDGPELVGERPNGGGLDLNRDCMKAESPEMQAVLEKVYSAWDPTVMMDLHTTDGTRHGYHLTYSPPLSPNTDPAVLAYSRDTLLPTVRTRLATAGWKLNDYGNIERRGTETVWATFGDEPRYVTNYAGLRGRVAVLSEAVSYLPFAQRVAVTDAFVVAVLEQVARDKTKLLKLARDADRRRRKELGVRFTMAARGTEKVPVEKRGAIVPDRRKAPTDLEDVTVPFYDRFQTTRSARVPDAYLIPPGHENVVALLQHHGIRTESVSKDEQARVQAFTITEKEVARMPFQGHRLTRLEGTFREETVTVAAGTIRVPTRQPLGPLAFHLLEPESLDGVAAWELLGELGTTYPILKTQP